MKIGWPNKKQTDINECASGNGGCGLRPCGNFPGGFGCSSTTCIAGFVANAVLGTCDGSPVPQLFNPFVNSLNQTCLLSNKISTNAQRPMAGALCLRATTRSERTTATQPNAFGALCTMALPVLVRFVLEGGGGPYFVGSLTMIVVPPDVDECKVANGNCVNSTCQNSFGSFSCTPINTGRLSLCRCDSFLSAHTSSITGGGGGGGATNSTCPQNCNSRGLCQGGVRLCFGGYGGLSCSDRKRKHKHSPALVNKRENLTKCVRTAPPLPFQIPISPVGFVANAASPNLIIDPNVAFSLYASAPRSVGSYSIDVTWMIYPAPRPLLPAKSASQCNRYCA